MSEHQLHDLAGSHDSMLIASESHKLLYIISKDKEERISLGIALKDKGLISKAFELPAKDIQILSEELKEILDIYF